MVEVKVIEGGSIFKLITFPQVFEKVCADLVRRSYKHLEGWV